MHKAGYIKDHDQYLLSLLERALYNWIVMNILIMNPVPKTYKEYKEHAIRICQVMERLEGNRAQQPQRCFPPRFNTRPPPFQFPPPRRPPPQTQFNPGLQSSAHPVNKATTFPGQGQPMILDRTAQ
jgi:hypothetical protein